jgi:hypothetical protein
MFSAEFRASLQALSAKPARKALPRVAERRQPDAAITSCPETLPLEDDPDDYVTPHIDVRPTCPLALPPPQPSWSFLF